MTKTATTLLNRRQALTLAAGFAAAATVTVDAAQAQRRRTTVSGNILYRERIALPRNATVEVTLSDVSRADAPSRTIAKTQFRARHGSPIPYQLLFDPRRIQQGHTYAVSARISVGRRLMFISDEANHINPLRGGNADIRVVRAGD